VRPVGYLQELYRDARSAEHKKTLLRINSQIVLHHLSTSGYFVYGEMHGLVHI
jgi:hypothetical protein